MALAILFQALDLISFMWVLTAFDISQESNPIAVSVYGVAGLGGLAAFKVAGVGIWYWIVTRLRPYKWLSLFGVIFAAAFGFLGYSVNIISVGISL